MAKAAPKKPRSPKTIPITQPWQENFKAFTMKTSFVLTLTRPMLEFLCATADNVKWDRSKYGERTIHAPDNWFATEHALEKRGLVTRIPFEVLKQKPLGDDNFMDNVCVLTPAGKAMIELIKVTGMFIEADEAIIRKHTNRG